MNVSELKDTDVVTSVLPKGGERYYLVNGGPVGWTRNENWADPTPEYEAKAILAARDTSRTPEERDKAAAHYRELAEKSRAYWAERS